MSWLYRSERSGLHGKPFSALKIRTLKEGADKRTSFANKDEYTKFGKFLRKSKWDELPQIVNVIRRQMNLVGPRPEPVEHSKLLPRETRKMLLSVRPGLTSLSSIAFAHEEKLLQGADSARDYHTKIKPIKVILDAFYVEHGDIFLDLWILYKTAILILKALF